MPVDPPFTVYREQLRSLYHGLALWNPDPPKRIFNNVSNLSIGDVGYLQEGTFIRMFNVTLPWDHESNRTLGVPEPYDRLDLGPFSNVRESNFSAGVYYSRSVTPEANAGGFQVMTPDE